MTEPDSQSISIVASQFRPAGYAAPAQIQQDGSSTKLAATASKVLQDPVALRKLCDRVLQLLEQDLRYQRERSHSYGRRG